MSPLDVVQFLVQANPESLQETSNDGELPLHLAFRYGAPRLAVIQYLVQANPESLQVRPQQQKETD
mgnify:CR=1 FL=1